MRQVVSKVKQAITESRQQAAQHMEQREQLLAVAVAGNSSAGAGHQLEGFVVADVGGRDSCPPAAAAHQFISNPWTSWFLPDVAANTAAGRLPPPADLPGAEQQLLEHRSSTALQDDSYIVSSSRPAAVSLGVQSCLLNAPGDAKAAIEQKPMSHFMWEQETTDSAHEDQLPSDETNSSLGLLLEAISSSPASKSPSMEPQPPHTLQQLQEEQQIEDLHGYQRRTAGAEVPVRRHSWAFDFGHLDVPELNTAAPTGTDASCKPQAAVRHRQLWSEKWVGNFGHLETCR